MGEGWCSRPLRRPGASPPSLRSAQRPLASHAVRLGLAVVCRSFGACSRRFARVRGWRGGVGEFLPETSSVERPLWSLVRQRFCGRTERLPHGQPFLVRAHCGVRGRSGLCWLVWLCSRLVGHPWRLVFLLAGLSGLFPCKREERVKLIRLDPSRLGFRAMVSSSGRFFRGLVLGLSSRRTQTVRATSDRYRGSFCVPTLSIRRQFEAPPASVHRFACA